MLQAAERSWLLFAARVVELNEARLEVLELAERTPTDDGDWEREVVRLRSSRALRDGLEGSLVLAWLV